ncbi:MAG TPA: amino acid adenylation domain-containing protein [Pseudonocardiaceae bacterium]|nr:amino acid adenylation domain-containing protein [Pseudonocardiaceae bacterium]
MGENTVDATRSITVHLDERRTRALLRDVPEVYRTQINDVLLTALTAVLREWTGQPALVDLEGHGREELFDDIDLSRTVGWFTSMFPVVLDLPDGDWGVVLKAVKERLRSVPRHGVGYGALRYLTGTAPAIDPQVGFNYLGQFDWPTGELCAGVPDGLDSDVDPAGLRTHLLDVVGSVEGGRLGLTWSYAKGVHEERTVARLAERMLAVLDEIVRHCAEPGAGGRTPSDFPLVPLDQATVDRLVGDGRDVEDIYPLTPMQAGMVFHGVSQAEQGLYLEQTSFILRGVTDPAALAAAWQHVVDRTPALRSSFAWQDLAEPVQIVHRQVRVPVRHLDWSGRTGDVQRLLDEDRAQGMDLTTAPLLRVTLIRLSDTEVQVLWTFHHVLLDGWSVFQVFSDLCTAYAGRALPVRRPFRDYLAWLAERDDAEAERFWRQTLDGLAGPTPLPYDRLPERAHATCSAEWLSRQLSEDDTARLVAFAQRHGLTLNVLLQGAWALLLSLYSGRRDVVFGATVSGRPADVPGSDDIVGIFINTVPVRVDIDRAASVADWLAGLQAAQADARAFDFVPLTRVQGWSGLPGGVNLFDSLVVFENYPISSAATGDGIAVRDVSAVETTNFPLTVGSAPGRELSVELGYDPALFDPATVGGIADRLLMLLGELAVDGDRPLGAVPVGTAEEHRLLAHWNDTGTAHCGSLPELFARQVHAHPDAIAVVAGDESLTYAELDRRANRLAHRLLGLGLGPEEPVGLLLGRLDAIVAELAVAKAGGAYLPLDQRAPVERQRLMLAGVRFVLTDGDAPAGRAIRPSDVDGCPDRAPAVRIDPDQLVYVMYTSGSTGQPKGVAVRHRDVAALAGDRRFAGGAHERTLLHSPLAFDATTYELWVPLLGGGQVVVAPERDIDPPLLRELIDTHGLTGLFLTTGLFRVLAQEVPGCFAGLRELWTGGDAVPAAQVRRVLDACPDLRVVDVYGPTETTTFATAYPIAGPVPDRLPIGGPLDGMRAYVVGPDMSLVPPGVPGELCLAGAGLARGYRSRPGLTAERFLPDPFGPPGERMYRTGDLVRWTADGALEFLGRTDDQVKLRGFRVEPGEAEAVLGRHPKVEQAVVVVREDQPGVKRLVAYVVTDVGHDELRTFLARSLPDYLVPSAFVVLDRLPLSGNGKLDRNALPAPEAAPTGDHVEPATDTERVLARLWADVLGVERVGATDDFYALGGDSIRSLHIATKASAAFEVRLTPADVLTAGTVTALADIVEETILSELESLAADQGL